MCNLTKKIKVVALGMFYGLGISTSAIADDTEIYTNSAIVDPSLQPNVLFLLDTSNSMGKNIDTRPPYDPAIDYSLLGPGGCFNNSKVYRVDGNTAKEADKFCKGQTSKVRGEAKISNFRCEDANMISQNGSGAPSEASDSTGFYIGRMAKYTKKNNGGGSRQWRDFIFGDSNGFVDCEADHGKHGPDDSSAKIFAANSTNQSLSGTNMWTSNISSGYNWSSRPIKSAYTGNYLNYLLTAPKTTTYRIEVIRDVMIDFVNSISGVNLAFMPYSKGTNNTTNNPFIPSLSNDASVGAMVEVAMDDVANNRGDVIERLKVYGTRHDVDNTSLQSGHRNLILGTPSSQQYYEALRYYRGANPVYGAISMGPPFGSSTTDGTLPSPAGDTPFSVANLPSVAAALDGDGSYKSPIVNECQKNNIILLTDGSPFIDPIVPAQLTENGITDTSCTLDPNCSTGKCTQSCLAKFAEAAANLTAGDTDTGFSEIEPISTYTVAFGSNIPILNAATAASRAGTDKGESYVANDADELAASLKEIVAETLDTEATFSSPAVSVNAFNRATHLDDLYFTLFKPAGGVHWDGNLKKYKLDFGPDVDDVDGDGDVTEVLPFIADSTATNAIDKLTGFFKDSAFSFWSAAPDGKAVPLGGAASELTVTRNIYTFTGTYTDTNGVSVPSDGDLTSSANALDKANASVTESLLDIVGTPDYIATYGTGPTTATIPYREALLDWAGGIDIRNEDGPDTNSIADARSIMGDPLHAEPALIQYGELAGNIPDLVAYVATNDGYLHAFNTIDGTEYWAFVPQELLPDLEDLFEDNGSIKNYGLDGDVVPWVNDANLDGTIGSGDHVYLYMGMRRGGRDIYSMDVTNRLKPVLRGIIKGGIGDYQELAQTWSTPNVEKIQLGGSERTVLIFGGGYDTNQDNAATRTPDSEGRAIYIADALTGERLWWAGPTGSGADKELSDMQYSIPGRIKPLDVDGDGFIDRLYAGDMGGQLWRFDIPADGLTQSNLGSKIDGGRIAEVAEDGSTADARRFYYPPDVSLIFEEGKAPYLAILAATGYRAHPLDKDIHDRMYMIRDYDIYTKPASYVTVSEANGDLFDTTNNNIGQGNTGQVNAAITGLNNKKGWYITFNELDGSFIGEKSLSEPLILNGVAIVTTFIPTDTSGVATGSCKPKEGNGTVFFVNITDGTPTYDISGDSTKTRPDRKNPLKRGGIPPSPNVIVGQKGTAMCVGTECTKSFEIDNIQKTHWYEREQ